MERRRREEERDGGGRYRGEGGERGRQGEGEGNRQIVNQIGTETEARGGGRGKDLSDAQLEPALVFLLLLQQFLGTDYEEREGRR